METIYDILLIGSGIVGCAAARELSRYRASVLVIDRGSDLAEGATKANSGIVHAGYDAIPGTKKALYNVRGAAMYEALAEVLGVPYRRCGALVLAFDDEDVLTLQKLLERGIANGVQGLEILDHEALLGMEPNLNPDVVAGLSVPTSAIVSPYEMAFALADDAAINGVSFLFDREVSSLRKEADGTFTVIAGDQVFRCRALINCAGASGAELHNQLCLDQLSMTHRRGQYYLLDRAVQQPFDRTLFQCPSRMGKGVLVSPTVHGNLLLGPTAEDINDPLDTATTADGLADILKKASKTWPQLSTRSNITNFSGIRAHLSTDDFIVGPSPDCAGYFEAIGIESPGLSSAPAIACDLAEAIADYLSLQRKTELLPYPVPPKPFSEMTDAEREQAIRENPAYGNIVCRCEVVTEAEIRRAIRRPLGARSVDGVKRRTRAGMGRCQGGFCLPRVAAIISEETGIPLMEVTKNGGSSYLLTDSIEDAMHGGLRHE